MAAAPDAAPVTGPSPRWRAARLLDSPHRLLFLAGALLWAVITAWWAAITLAPLTAGSPDWAVAPAAAHALAMTFGFMPLFIAGFLFTAGPTWLRVAAPDARRLRTPTLLIVIGWAAALPAMHWRTAWAAAALTAVASGWSALSGRFVQLVRSSRADDKLHATGLAAAAGVIALALWWAALALALEQPIAQRAAARLGLWGGVGCVFVVAAHRLTPFFHPPLVKRLPLGLLWPVLAGLGLRGAADLAGLWAAAPWPAALNAALALLNGLLGLALLIAAFDASLAQARRAPMVQMLHAGFVWLGLSFGLEAVSRAMLSAGHAAGLGHAPLHALSLGFMAGTLLAMASRVAAGQHGRTVAIDGPVRLMHLALQCVVAARVAAAIWPAWATVLHAAAALGFAALALAWALRHGAWFGRPRLTPGRLVPPRST